VEAYFTLTRHDTTHTQARHVTSRQQAGAAAARGGLSRGGAVSDVRTWRLRGEGAVRRGTSAPPRSHARR
jgi:hypothetical protein